MLDVKKELVTALQSITAALPVYYELTVDSGTPIPCITYIEQRNQDDETCEYFGYSTIGFYVKVWSNSVEDIATYSQQVDAKMRSLGYKRESSNELFVDNLICKVMLYIGLGKEKYN